MRLPFRLHHLPQRGLDLRRVLGTIVSGVVVLGVAFFLYSVWLFLDLESDRLQGLETSEERLPVLKRPLLEEFAARVQNAPPLPSAPLPVSRSNRAPSRSFPVGSSVPSPTPEARPTP